MNKHDRKFSDYIAEHRATAETGEYRTQGKGNDNGYAGKHIFEPACKLFLGTTKGAFCSKQGNIDGKKYGFRLTYKSGYGDITPVTKDGKFKTREFIGADYVVWAGDPLADVANALVVRMADFLAATEMLRIWYDSSQYLGTHDPAYKGSGKLKPGAYKNILMFVSNKATVDRVMNSIAIGTLADFKAKRIK